MEAPTMSYSLNTILNQLYGHSNNYHDFHYQFDNNSNYLILPVPFIKMFSKYIDSCLNNYIYGKIIKNIRFHYKIKVKFNLSKYQISRLYLEVIFNRKKTAELDTLFSQLKLYGNFLIEMNITYDEIINNIYQCQQNTNFHSQNSIDKLNEKLEKLKHHDLDVNLEEVRGIESRIHELRSNMRHCSIDYIDNHVYDMVKQMLDNKLNYNIKQNIIGKVSNYLETMNQTSSCSYKMLEDYESNNGESLGKTYENSIYEILKPMLNNYGYEIIQNVEFTFRYDLSGVKLEYDFIVGKIMNNTFVIHGVFDAKISKVLIKKDIDKFIQSIDSLKQNKLQLRYIQNKEYFTKFSKISPPENNDIIFGYFCKPHINQEKEISKVISSYLIQHSKHTFDLIESSYINFSESMLTEIEHIVMNENKDLITILESNNTRIYHQI